MLNRFKFTLFIFCMTSLYHLIWFAIGFWEKKILLSNGTETILFIYYMTIIPFKLFPKITNSEGINLILYSFCIPLFCGLLCDILLSILKFFRKHKR